MYIFFDTEFTGLQKDTDLISIGLVTWEGNSFYAEFTDYREELCDDWIKDNVISKLISKNPGITKKPQNYHVGTKAQIAAKLREWFSQFLEGVVLVSDVCHYDMVLLLDLFGGALNIPANISPVCHDIVYDITKYVKMSTPGFYNDITIEDIRNFSAEKRAFDLAFDLDREELVGDLVNLIGLTVNAIPLDKTMKHTALHDAHVIRYLFSLLGIYFKQRSPSALLQCSSYKL